MAEYHVLVERAVGILRMVCAQFELDVCAYVCRAHGTCILKILLRSTVRFSIENTRPYLTGTGTVGKN